MSTTDEGTQQQQQQTVAGRLSADKAFLDKLSKSKEKSKEKPSGGKRKRSSSSTKSEKEGDTKHKNKNKATTNGTNGIHPAAAEGEGEKEGEDSTEQQQQKKKRKKKHREHYFGQRLQMRFRKTFLDASLHKLTVENLDNLQEFVITSISLNCSSLKPSKLQTVSLKLVEGAVRLFMTPDMYHEMWPDCQTYVMKLHQLAFYKREKMHEQAQTIEASLNRKERNEQARATDIRKLLLRHNGGCDISERAINAIRYVSHYIIDDILVRAYDFCKAAKRDVVYPSDLRLGIRADRCTMKMFGDVRIAGANHDGFISQKYLRWSKTEEVRKEQRNGGFLTTFSVPEHKFSEEKLRMLSNDINGMDNIQVKAKRGKYQNEPLSRDPEIRAAQLEARRSKSKRSGKASRTGGKKHSTKGKEKGKEKSKDKESKAKEKEDKAREKREVKEAKAKEKEEKRAAKEQAKKDKQLEKQKEKEEKKAAKKKSKRKRDETDAEATEAEPEKEKEKESSVLTTAAEAAAETEEAVENKKKSSKQPKNNKNKKVKIVENPSDAKKGDEGDEDIDMGMSSSSSSSSSSELEKAPVKSETVVQDSNKDDGDVDLFGSSSVSEDTEKTPVAKEEASSSSSKEDDAEEDAEEEEEEA